MKFFKILFLNFCLSQALYSSQDPQILNEHTVRLVCIDSRLTYESVVNSYTQNELIDGVIKTSTTHTDKLTPNKLISQLSTREYQIRTGLQTTIKNILINILKQKILNVTIFKTGPNEVPYTEHTSKHVTSASSNNEPIIYRDGTSKINHPIYSLYSLNYLKNNFPNDTLVFFILGLSDATLNSAEDGEKTLYFFLRTLIYSTDLTINKAKGYPKIIGGTLIERYYVDYTDMTLPICNKYVIRHRFVFDLNPKSKECNIVTHYPFIINGISTDYNFANIQFLKHLDYFASLIDRRKFDNFDPDFNKCISELLPRNFSNFTNNQKLILSLDSFRSLLMLSVIKKTRPQPLYEFFEDYDANNARIYSNMISAYDTLGRAIFVSHRESLIVYFLIENYLYNNEDITDDDRENLVEYFKNCIIDSFQRSGKIRIVDFFLETEELRSILFDNPKDEVIKNLGDESLKTIYQTKHRLLENELLIAGNIIEGDYDDKVSETARAINKKLIPIIALKPGLEQ